MSTVSLYEYPDEAVLEHYRGMLRGYVIKQGLVTDADDILSEAITRFLEHRASIDLSTDPMRWLWCITRNLCTDVHRFRNRVDAPGAGEMELLVKGTAPSALEEIETRELSDRLAAALRALPERERAIFLERHLLDLDYEEISRRHGISVNTLRQVVYRARQQLIAMLEDVRTFGLLVVFRLRSRRSAAIGESPGFVATALAQAAVPLAILVGVVSGGASPGSVVVPTAAVAPADDMRRPGDHVQEVAHASPAASLRLAAGRPGGERDSSSIGSGVVRDAPEVDSTVTAKPDDPCLGRRGEYEVTVKVGEVTYWHTKITNHSIPDGPVKSTVCSLSARADLRASAP